MLEFDEDHPAAKEWYAQPQRNKTVAVSNSQSRIKARKRGRTKANGRGPSFDSCICKIPVLMQRHTAFQTLSAAQIRVLMLAMTKYDNAKYHSIRDDQGRYIFNFTYIEASRELCVSTPTFSTALQELERRGFIEVAVAGGLKGVNGVPSIFTLCENWKVWQMPEELRNAKEQKQIATKARLRGYASEPLKPT